MFNSERIHRGKHFSSMIVRCEYARIDIPLPFLPLIRVLSVIEILTLEKDVLLLSFAIDPRQRRITEITR